MGDRLPPLTRVANDGVAPARVRFARFDRLTADQSGPVAVLDLAALTANAMSLVDRAGGLPIRVASKSVRVTEVLRAVLALDGFAGVLAFTLPEAIDLVRAGVTDDVVVGYPTADRAALATLCADPNLLRAVTLMVDHPRQLALIDAARGTGAAGPDVRLCLDLDCSYRFGAVHIGARRSPIHTPEQAAAAAAQIAAHAGVTLVGVMGYEAQVAGLTDDGPHISALKALSVRELRSRRDAAVRAVREHADLEFVNGGGTGSFETTRASTTVTELAAGSGLFGPHLFDRYRTFTLAHALVFGLHVVRHPAPHLATVLGGGWIASGPHGPDRAPKPVWPEGLSLLATEAAGEVQTPLRCQGERPGIGDRVWFRHAKAGEICEHVNTVTVVHGDEILATVPTYRGEGRAYL